MVIVNLYAPVRLVSGGACFLLLLRVYRSLVDVRVIVVSGRSFVDKRGLGK